VSEALVVGTVRQALEMAIAVSLPMLAAGLIAGVAVSLFQTITSIQDNVLAFIPRAAAIVVVFALTFPWMLRQVSGFAADIVRRLPDFIR
jgi:flagellar biosynthetic protein FliQ